MHRYIWSALAITLGVLILLVWRYFHRRSWSQGYKDETMRRHVNRNYL